MQSVNPLPLVTSFHPTAYRSIRFYGDVLCASLHLTLFSDDPADKTRCKICLWLYFPLSASDEFDTVYLWPRKFTSLWVLGKPKTDYLTSNEAQWCMWLTLDVQPCKNNKPIRLPPGNRDQKFDEREAIISDCYFRCSGHHSVQFVVTVLSGICPHDIICFSVHADYASYSCCTKSLNGTLRNSWTGWKFSIMSFMDSSLGFLDIFNSFLLLKPYKNGPFQVVR